MDVTVLALDSAIARIFTGVMLAYPWADASGAAAGLCAGKPVRELAAPPVGSTGCCQLPHTSEGRVSERALVESATSC